MSDHSQIDARDLEALLDTLIPRSSDGKLLQQLDPVRKRGEFWRRV